MCPFQFITPVHSSTPQATLPYPYMIPTTYFSTPMHPQPLQPWTTTIQIEPSVAMAQVVSGATTSMDLGDTRDGREFAWQEATFGAVDDQ